jgi:hypothetical protein
MAAVQIQKAQSLRSVVFVPEIIQQEQIADQSFKAWLAQCRIRSGATQATRATTRCAGSGAGRSVDGGFMFTRSCQAVDPPSRCQSTRLEVKLGWIISTIG